MPSLDVLITFLPHLVGLGPQALALLGALVVSCTAGQALALAASRIFPPASRVAHILGVIAVDLSRVSDIMRKLGAATARLLKVGAASLVLFVVSCGCSAAVPAPTPAELESVALKAATVTCAAYHASEMPAGTSAAEVIAKFCATRDALAPFFVDRPRPVHVANDAGAHD